MRVGATGEDLIGEARDPAGNRVVVPLLLWWGKVLLHHPELESHLADVLRAISEPDLITPDTSSYRRRRHFLRGAGPSRWLMVVVSYEQDPARLITAFAKRKDPDSWRK